MHHHPQGSFANGSFGQYFFVVLKTERGKLATATKWLRRSLWQIQADPDRLRVGANKLLSEIPAEKRSGQFTGPP